MLYNKYIVIDISFSLADNVPRYVKDLHIPNPLTDEHKFCNDLLHEPIQAMYLLVSPEQLRQYYLSQRILRWKLQCKVNTILTNVQKFSDKECKDGNVMNIVKYTTSDIKSFQAGDVKRIENTLEYVNHFKLKSLTKCKDSLKSYRSGLFNHDHDINSSLKQMSLIFMTMLWKNLKSQSTKLKKNVSKLLTVLTELKRVHFQIDITEKEEKRAIKRKRDNSPRNQKEKKKRLLEKCVDVLGLILDPKNPEIEQYLAREQYDAIQITGENIITDPSKLRPRFHSKALEHLLEKKIFVDGGEDKVKVMITNLANTQKETESKNKEKLEIKKKKLEDAKKQSIITTFFHEK